MVKNHSALFNDDYNVEIDGKEIDKEIFNNEQADYILEDRQELIDKLIDWISEATRDKEVMKDDLKYLMALYDDYVWSSISTNEYIAKSDNPKEWNSICEDILTLNGEVD